MIRIGITLHEQVADPGFFQGGDMKPRGVNTQFCQILPKTA